MTRARIAGTGITVARLGFGTAALLGRIGERDSLRLLERAYDEGIRYYDTAPSYGYGLAEHLVGKFAAKRSDIVIATKFGLSYRGRSSSFVQTAAALARPLLSVSPAIRSKLGSAVRRSTAPMSQFSVTAAQESLMKSLKALRRDCIDVFLLHECRPADLENDELLAFLDEAVRAGRVRTFGIGTDAATAAYAMRSAPGFSRVLQFENNNRNANIDRYAISSEDRTVITHTPFGGVVHRLDGDPSEHLRFALRSNRNGIVLFSSSKDAGIRANAEVARSLTES